MSSYNHTSHLGVQAIRWQLQYFNRMRCQWVRMIHVLCWLDCILFLVGLQGIVLPIATTTSSSFSEESMFLLQRSLDVHWCDWGGKLTLYFEHYHGCFPKEGGDSIGFGSYLRAIFEIENNLILFRMKIDRYFLFHHKGDFTWQCLFLFTITFY